MKILFLDMDGVVNSNFYIKKWINNKQKQLQNDGYFGNQLKFKLRQDYAKQFNHCKELIFPALAKRITNIVDKTQCKIVWSSSWRLLPQYAKIDKAKQMFNRRGLIGQALIGYTSIHSRYDDGCRGTNIRYWLEQHNEVEKSVVLDDRWDAGVNLPKNCVFFQTNVEHGITEKIKKQIINYFNN